MPRRSAPATRPSVGLCVQVDPDLRQRVKEAAAICEESVQQFVTGILAAAADEVLARPRPSR